MRGANSVEIDGRKRDAEAIGFCTRYGFPTASVLARFYEDGDDAYKTSRIR